LLERLERGVAVLSVGGTIYVAVDVFDKGRAEAIFVSDP